LVLFVVGHRRYLVGFWLRRLMKGLSVEGRDRLRRRVVDGLGFGVRLRRGNVIDRLGLPHLALHPLGGHLGHQAGGPALDVVRLVLIAELLLCPRFLPDGFGRGRCPCRIVLGWEVDGQCRLSLFSVEPGL